MFFKQATRLRLRRRAEVTQRESVDPCTVVITNKILSAGVEEEYLECELQGDDLAGKDYRMVTVQGLSANWAMQNGIVSGESTIFSQGSLIDDDTNALIITDWTDVEVMVSRLDTHECTKGGSMMDSHSVVSQVKQNTATNGDVFDRRGRNLADDVIKKVLVIRFVASDAQTTATETELADDIFGASGDVVNLQSQYNACSYGQLQFNALTSNTAVGTDGVYTVNLPDTVIAGAADSTIRNAARDEATAQLGTLTDIADHVIICLPPGTGDWLAYAYVNHWLSFRLQR